MNARVGFIVDQWVPALDWNTIRHTGVRSLWQGAASASAMGVMRFGWMAEEVNCRPEYALTYELYRPFRHYDLLLLLKSFNPASTRLAARHQERGGRVVFEVNVNYFETGGAVHYADMLPTATQVEEATYLARTADGVIAASAFIADRCVALNPSTVCIPDNVNMKLVPSPTAPARQRQPLPLLWCGQALKLSELLAIEPVLRKFRRHIKLTFVADPLSALARWPEGDRRRFQSLMDDVSHEHILYQSIPHLLQIYSGGGVVIAPRFLDSAYNMGHTEWKITLGMACGCLALGSPLPSYLRVHELSGGKGVRICPRTEDWEQAFDALLTNKVDWQDEGWAARRVVEEHYSTAILSARHAAFVRKILKKESSCAGC